MGEKQKTPAVTCGRFCISLLYKVMKAEGTHEDTIEQMDRLFGFGLPGGNYEADTDPNVPVPSLQ